MTYEPRTTEEVYESLRVSLSGKITKLRNFTDRSFNYVWTQAFADEIQTLEAKAKVAELAGTVEYAGKELSEDDIEDLELGDSVTAEQLNEFVDDDQLDRYVDIVGIDRFQGAPATGTITILTQSEETIIPEGTIVTTTPDSTGGAKEYEVTERTVSPDNDTSVTDVPIQSIENGAEYNVPANEIVRFDSPPIGVKGVTNNAATTGGEDIESNEELRERARNAVTTASLGGTTNGIRGYIQQNIESVGQGDVVVDEFTDATPPYVDVVVDGGIESELTEAIETARPTGIRHNLARPEIIQLGWDIRLIGDDIQNQSTKDTIETYLLDKGIGETFYEDKFIQMVLNADDDIVTIDRLGGYVERVTGEEFTYESGKDTYRLDFTALEPSDSNDTVTVIDETGKEYETDTDYAVKDETNDGYNETIDWSIGGESPSDGDDFSVDYDVVDPGTTSIDKYYTNTLVRDEVFEWNADYTESFIYSDSEDRYTLNLVPFVSNIEIGSPDLSGTSTIYDEGTDYEIIDENGTGVAQTIDWSIGGSSPADGDAFVVSYTQRVYETEYDIVETPSGEITDVNNNTYTEGNEYTLIDYNGDGTDDSISWNDSSTVTNSFSDQDEFYITYFNNGNININSRKKISPGTITIEQV